MVILIILSIVFFIAFVFLLKAWHFCKNKGYRALSRLLGMGAGIICLAFLISSFFAVKDFFKKADKRDLSQSDIVATGSEDSSLNASTLISEEVEESTDLASEDASDDIVETVIEGPKTYVFPVMSGYSYTSATLGITYNMRLQLQTFMRSFILMSWLETEEQRCSQNPMMDIGQSEYPVSMWESLAVKMVQLF